MGTNAPFGAYPKWATDANNNVTGLVGPDLATHATLGSSTITVGAGGRYSTIQAAIDSITDNLPVNHSSGTVNVANGSAQITFSAAPANDKVVAGRDLFTVDGSRYYQLLNGPTVTGGAIYNLAEVYQGSTNAAATYSVIKPNPRTIILLPGVYDYTGYTLAQNILLKPYVNLVGVSRDGCIIRRNKNNSTPDTTPVMAIAHGCVVENLTIDATDGHFLCYRMGLTARGTSQTQAMKYSKWGLRNVALLNKDPNGIDPGADYDIDSSYYNSDEMLLDGCYFEHCWDGFTWKTAGSGRLKVTFNNPIIYKTPFPKGLYQTGAAFIRTGVQAASTTDVVMINPIYDQRTFAAGEVVNDSIGGLIAGAGGTTGGCYGMLFVGGGSTGKVLNPAIDMDVGSNYGRNAGVGLAGTAGTSELTVIGGYINIAGAAAAGGTDNNSDGAFNELAAGTLTVCGTRIDSGKNGVRQLTAGGVTNLQGGARIKGTTNSLVNTAGTMNQSANVSLAGVATSGTITSAET